MFDSSSHGNSANGVTQLFKDIRFFFRRNYTFMTTAELEAVKKELADISAFVKERGEQRLNEETSRLASAVETLVSSARKSQRDDLLKISNPGEIRVESGPYAGCDALDLAIVRSLHKASHAFDSTSGSEHWKDRLKAAMDSITAGTGDEVDPAELQTLALHAVASDIRATKPAIANAVWQARQGVGSALDDARVLSERYNAALIEYRALIESGFSDSESGKVGHDSDSTI